ncbi:TonB-dependent siderophore receptor [Fulvivirgaceae bacterium PWU5]|uniref:TonB-dependent siderophore receptor n=1 Tax=Dawidia cretensis TaxID=2782350 RepID=A0AAP2DYS6_9BACT|nr:TonB-dependent receptor [Dawidia cretensis]MBT1709853.1 TonB-dependent siderophore receptor [Dawidia cretensis]
MHHLSTNLFRIILFVLLLGATTAFAQSGKVAGTIKNAAGESLPGASVMAEGTTGGTVSDADGHYELSLAPGQYRLSTSMVGYTPQVKNVTVTDGSSQTFDFELAENDNVLQQVEIIGRKEQSYKNSQTFIGSKTELAAKDLPQSAAFVTKELIADQGLMRVGETVKNMSGVSQFTTYDDITIRGYRINGQSNTQLLNGMRTSSGFWKQPLANYLERVEVLKGPSSALFGNATPGGVVNRVTKKPLDYQRNSLDFSFGSFNTFRALGDFTGPVNDGGKLLYRINLGYEDANSFRDLQFDKNIVIAPSLSFLASEKTRLNLDIIYNQSDSRLDRGQATMQNDLYSTPTSLALSSANDFLKENTYNISVSLNHQFTERLSFNVAYLKTGYNEDLLEHRSANAYARDEQGQAMTDHIAMQVFQRKRRRYSDNLSAFLNYTAHTGAIEHKILLGHDYAQDELPPGASQITAGGYLNRVDAEGNAILVPNVPHFDLQNPLASQGLKDMTKYTYVTAAQAPTFYNLHGTYAQDLIKYGKFQALLGVRYERYIDKVGYRTSDEKNVRQNAFLPRVGLVYALLPQINLYGTYVEGYNPQTASSISNPNAGGPFDPLTSKMYEVGAKSEWFEKQLSMTVAVYQIEQQGTLLNANDPGNPELLRQIGEDRSRGIELDILGHILPHWSILTTYSYNDASITESFNEAEVGRQMPNAPHHQGSFWTRYSIPRGDFTGLGFGIGTNYVGRRVLSINAQQSIPDYVLVDAALYYTVNKVKIQCNFNNIFDKTYWVGGYDYIRLFPGKPHNFLVTLGYTF